MSEKYQDPNRVRRFFGLLNENDIDYILIKNIDQELPARLEVGKDIDIIVSDESKESFTKLMGKIGRQYVHPWGKIQGWTNLYGLPEFEMWRLIQKENFFVDVTYRLCCKSLVPKTWIPLDQTIQDRAWKERRFDSENGWWRLDSETEFVYLIARSVFDKQTFSEKYILELQSLLRIIDKNVALSLLRTVFFNYADDLFDHIVSENYKNIWQNYITYIGY